jgi:uncharacterized membrane protein
VKTQLLGLWTRLRSSYWFIPSIMLALSLGLSLVMLRLDESINVNSLPTLIWLYISEPEGARALLSTVAGSMITVAGVAFSIIIVALSLASSQFGPRLLRNFMRDTGNQLVLGTFIATFVYCLLVLRSIRTLGDDVFVPHLSITLALVLTTVSLGVFIYFIHHAAASIQISTILERLGRELEREIQQFFPDPLGVGPREGEDVHIQVPDGFHSDAKAIESTVTGYLQTVDEDGLFELAKTHDLLIAFKFRPGDFVVQGEDLLRVWPPERVDDALEAELHREFVLGPHRSRDQDILFIFDQLVEVASRALSPGINDPVTAIMCIDRIGSGLAMMVQREIPSAYRLDKDNRLRAIVRPVTFEEAVTRTLGPIRTYGASHPTVAVHLLTTLERITKRTTSARLRKVLLQEAKRIKHQSESELKDAHDLERVASQFRAVEHAFGEPHAAPPDLG